MLPWNVHNSYVASDPLSGGKSSEAWVTILVRSPEYWSTIKRNRPPVPQSATLEIKQKAILAGRLNATDDFDTLEQLTFSVSGPPLHGTVQLNGSSFRYIPDPDFWGQDTFAFKVCAVARR